jgi:thiol-disulfide isomerase/thioredoxin
MERMPKIVNHFSHFCVLSPHKVKKMNRLVPGLMLLLLFWTCKPEAEEVNALKTGVWRGVITMQDRQLPFNFEVVRDSNGGYDVFLINAEERLLLDEVTVTEDSVDAALHIFDANIKAAIVNDSLKGVFVKNFATDYHLPFEAAWGQEYRFDSVASDTPADFSGKYSVTFVHEKDTTQAIAIFHQSGNKVSGSFLTPTGDYRFLDGNASGSTLKLSTFDGNYLYLFTARMRDDGKIEGEFISGKTWKERWIAEKNENATLPDAESLTWLKDAYDKITFKFPDVTGQVKSLDDEKYRNKVVILQLLGTWCPNCMDETKYLAPWYEENKDRGVEIIGLAYERKDDFEYASERVKKMAQKMEVGYDILIAGTDDKEKAGQTLPMLNAVVAFPTTIFIGKDGKVKKIHTGFNGPGTGRYFEQFKEDFNETVNELLMEGLTAEAD